jgi:hypothetical protein
MPSIPSTTKQRLQKFVAFVVVVVVVVEQTVMPDSFFSAPKQKKRKRAESTSHGPKKFPRNAKQHGKQTAGAAPAGRGKRARDEELSDQTDEDGDVDDMDLRADHAVEDSGEEDENETPAEKRLRLAQLYLESVKVGLGVCSSYSSFVFIVDLGNSRWRI